MSTFHIIMNRKAGTAGAQQRTDITKAFESHNAKFKVHLVSGDIGAVAAKAADQCDVLVAAGGDGTVGAVAQAAIAANKPLGVIAAGTLNHFAKDAGIPLTIAEAVDAVVTGDTKLIDYATAGDRLFLNNASIGVYPKLVRRRQQQQQRVGKWPALARELVSLVRQPLRRRKIQLTYGGETREVRSPFIFIGNNDYHTPEAGLGGRTSLSSGRLTLFVYTQTNWVRFAIELFKAFHGQQTHAAMRTSHPQKIIVNTSSATTEIATDGEVSRQTLPLTVKIHPRALKLRVPRT